MTMKYEGCPKCKGTVINTEVLAMIGKSGMNLYFFDVEICDKCKYSELYFRFK